MKMRDGSPLLPIILVVVLVISGAYASLFILQTNSFGSNTPIRQAFPSGGSDSVGKLTSTEYLSWTNSSLFLTAVWTGASSPQTEPPPNITSIQYQNNSFLGLGTPVFNNLTLFEPGVKGNATVNASPTTPAPSQSNAWGWLSYLSSFGSPLTIEAGQWTFNIGLNVTSSATSPTAGNLYVGFEAYAYNTSNKKFTLLFGNENKTFSVGSAPAGVYQVPIVVNAPQINFSSTESLFVEYYLNASAYTPHTSMSVNFQVGGASGAEYNFTYPHYGLLIGSVTPSTATVTLNGVPIQINSTGGFNVSAAPMYYTADTTAAGYVSNSTKVDVLSGETTYLTIKLIKLYEVIFTEQGLPTGTNWSVQFNGKNNSSQQPSIGFLAVNGSYSYSVSPLSGYKFTLSQQSPIDIAGANVGVTVTFRQVLYDVWFNETGLAGGTLWKVKIYNQTSGFNQTNSSETASVEAVIPNGTYSYIIQTVGNEFSAPGGSVTVSGSSVSESILFSPVTYAVYFTETGLPSDTLWYVNITGQQSHSSNAKSMTVSLLNGTYTYSIGTAKNTYSSAGGSVIVDGASNTRSIIFNPVNYTVTFTESGLPSGTRWYVNLSNGQSLSNTTSTITFNEHNGTYSYAITKVSGYRLVNPDGNVTVNGGASNITINFAAVSASPGFALSTETMLFVIVVGALIALEVVTGYLYFRKAREKNEEREGESDVALGKPVDPTLTQMLNSGTIPGRSASGVLRTNPRNQTAVDTVAGTMGAVASTASYAEIMEGGNSYAVFEQTAQSSMELFEAGLRRGFKGLCFTRQYPEKITQKFSTDGTAVFWLSNMGSENSIRPKDLEKITLQCNEYLSKWKCIIMIDGLEYLITNNSFITVLKMLQFLRDATAVNKSILVLSVNPNAIGENEVNLIMREVDKVLR